MKNTIYFFIYFFSLVWGSPRKNEWRWQQEVDYTMVIDVDVENHTYKGTQSLVYTNNSPDDLDRVFYHLYLMLLSLARIWNKTQDTRLTIQELCQKTF